MAVAFQPQAMEPLGVTVSYPILYLPMRDEIDRRPRPLLFLLETIQNLMAAMSESVEQSRVSRPHMNGGESHECTKGTWSTWQQALTTRQRQ